MSKINKAFLLESINEIKKGSEEKKRKFLETVELQVGLKNYDPARDKRFSGTVKLRHIPKVVFMAHAESYLARIKRAHIRSSAL